MKRLLVVGARDRHGIAHPLPECLGNCNQGRADCDCELSNVVPLRPRSPVCVRPDITVHRISRVRRMRRFLRALFHFLTARKADLS